MKNYKVSTEYQLWFAIASILISFISLLPIIAPVTLNEGNLISLSNVFRFDSFRLEFLEIDPRIFNNSIYGSHYIYFKNNVLNLAAALMFVYASVGYLVRRGEKRKLLKFAFSIVLFTTFLLLIQDAKMWFNYGHFNLKIVWHLALILFSFYSLNHLEERYFIQLNDDLKVKIDHSVYKASKKMRFVNFLVDTSIMLLLCLKMIPILFPEFLVEKIGRNPGNLTLFICGVVITAFYYFFFEILLKRTPGKYLTETIVLEENKESPTFSKILQKSFYRSIPFNALSFFSKNGWHDTLSATTVFSLARSKNPLKPILIILGLVISLIALNLIIQYWLNWQTMNEQTGTLFPL